MDVLQEALRDAQTLSKGEEHALSAANQGMDLPLQLECIQTVCLDDWRVYMVKRVAPVRNTIRNRGHL